jgi:hypothetical protein
MRILLFILLSFAVKAANLDAGFVRALHKVETGGRNGAILGDNGRALGPFQIHKNYWLDAVTFDKSIGGKYADCANYSYSLKIVTAYLNKYGKAAILKKDYKSQARIHNGGPNGLDKEQTNIYWLKVKKNL